MSGLTSRRPGPAPATSRPWRDPVRRWPAREMSGLAYVVGTAAFAALAALDSEDLAGADELNAVSSARGKDAVA